VQAEADVVQQHRSHLLGLAYRLIGLLADAQDAVQEAWLRLARLSDADRAAIRDPCGWLTTVVGRLCLDRLRSAAVQRERYVGSWLPEQTCWSSKSTPTAGTKKWSGWPVTRSPKYTSRSRCGSCRPTSSAASASLSGPAVRAPYGRLTPPLTDAYRQVLDGVGVSRCKPGAVAPL
jgi:hypothetical protein